MITSRLEPFQYALTGSILNLILGAKDLLLSSAGGATLRMEEIAQVDISQTIADMNDLILRGKVILGQKFAWGQLYGGKSMDTLKKAAHEKLSVIRPVNRILPMRVTQNLVLDKWSQSRTIITMEETTTIEQGDGDLQTQKKGSLVNLDKAADPPKITAPNGKDHVDIVMVEWA